MPGRFGSWVFPDVRGNRTIRAACQVVRAIDERREGTREGAIWLDVQGYADLLFSDEPERYWRAYVKQAPSSDEWKGQAKFTIEWSAEPYAYSVSTSEMCVTATGGSDSDTFVVTDDVPACPIIEITPLNGGISSYVLTLNGYELSVTGPITSGNTQTVSSCSYTITSGATGEEQLTGAYDPDPHWTVDASGEFPLLVSGSNAWDFEWEGSATNVRICIFWRERLY